MVIIEDRIREWKESVLPIRDQAIEDSKSVFLKEVNHNDFPTQNELNQAGFAARNKALSLLIADTVLGQLPNGPVRPDSRETLRTSWLSLMPELNIPPPGAEVILPLWRLAIAASVGSVLGMVTMGALSFWFLGIREIGMLFGAMFGAASFVAGLWFAASSSAVRTVLAGIVGVSVAAETLLLMPGIGLGRLWRHLIGTGGLWKRLFFYISLIFLLIFAKQKYQYDRQNYARIVHGFLEQWIDYGLLLLISLTGNRAEVSYREMLDPAIARAIINLHTAHANDLAPAAEAVLQEARRLGLEGINNQPRFVDECPVSKLTLKWEEDLKKKYKCFGIIEPGDPVIVEDEPVIQNGMVAELGSVRKARR